MSWRHVVIEGYCFGEKKHIYPCGKPHISSFCISDGKCPHFAYADSSELEASLYAPLHKIIGIKLLSLWEEIYWKVRWILWDRWPRQRRASDEFFKSIPVVKCPTWDYGLEKAKQDFPAWLEKAIKEN